MIKATVFDLDHTLFDRYATLREIVKHFREGFKIAEGITDEYIGEQLEWADKQFAHHGWEQIHRHLIDCGIFAEEPEYEYYSNYLLSLLYKTAVPFEFAIPTLEELSSMGLKVALITNGFHDRQYKKLEMTGLTHCFDSIIVTGDIGEQKPGRLSFDLMAQQLGLEPSEMLYIGDNPLNDVEGSRNAGYIPVWVRTTGVWSFPDIEKPELQVDTVAEIPALVRKLNR